MTNYLNNLGQLKKGKTRSISAENFNGKKGKGGMATEGTGAVPSRELGQKWKVSPSIEIKSKEIFTIADIKGEGIIQHIWITTFHKNWRDLILRIYWEDCKSPSIEVPIGDFFCNGWCVPANVNSLPISVNPAGGMNSYWEMPFKKSARIELENRSNEDFPVYFQVTYTETPQPDKIAYLHAFWNRSNPVGYLEDHVILPKINGKGHYVGTYIAWQVNNAGWWGEGEVKMFMDGDEEFPTICGTGTEDYFGGAWNWEYPKGEYGLYSTPFLGMHQVIKPDGLYQSQQRFGMYRWHIQDPILFEEDFKVTIQALGWRGDNRYLPLQDDISSTAFWYQDIPNALPKKLPEKNDLEVI